MFHSIFRYGKFAYFIVENISRRKEWDKAYWQITKALSPSNLLNIPLSGHLPNFSPPNNLNS